ncbi:MAG: hypothetical protein JNM36_19115 [Chitinophagales bacterium]|nr:hypothetical protein [Chitinophagales bacterium]HNI44630.1 hypothetical protein [Chitinophagales bacterium]
MWYKKILLISYLCLLCSLTSCKFGNGRADDDALTDEEQAQNLEELRDSLQQEFRKNLDSISQMTPNAPKDLATKTDVADFIPDIEGYTKVGKLKSTQSQIQQTAYLQLEQNYQRGDEKVTVAIVDYGANSPTYALAAQALTFSYASKDDNIKQQPYNADDSDLVGRISYNKQTKEATALLGVANRFFISVSADQQNNADFVKDIMENMDIDALKEF